MEELYRYFVFGTGDTGPVLLCKGWDSYSYSSPRGGGTLRNAVTVTPFLPIPGSSILGTFGADIVAAPIDLLPCSCEGDAASSALAAATRSPTDASRDCSFRSSGTLVMLGVAIQYLF